MSVFRLLTLMLGLSEGWGCAQSEAGVTCGHWEELPEKPLELTGDTGEGKVWLWISASSFACVRSTAMLLPQMGRELFASWYGGLPTWLGGG